MKTFFDRCRPCYDGDGGGDGGDAGGGAGTTGGFAGEDAGVFSGFGTDTGVAEGMDATTAEATSNPWGGGTYGAVDSTYGMTSEAPSDAYTSYAEVSPTNPWGTPTDYNTHPDLATVSTPTSWTWGEQGWNAPMEANPVTTTPVTGITDESFITDVPFNPTDPVTQMTDLSVPDQLAAIGVTGHVSSEPVGPQGTTQGPTQGVSTPNVAPTATTPTGLDMTGINFGYNTPPTSGQQGNMPILVWDDVSGSYKAAGGGLAGLVSGGY